MHERLELKTHRLAVALTTAWPMVLGLLLVIAASLLILPVQAALIIAAFMALVVLITFLCCLPMYLGTYLFLPATAYKGARLIARLGRHNRNETEVYSVPASDFIVKQNFLEKPLHVCHIRVKGTTLYYRGVPEVETVKEWIQANFPEKTVDMLNQENRPKKKKK